MFAPTLTQMHWQRPRALERKYQLVSGYFQVGELKFVSSMTMKAIAEFEGQRFRISREGLFQNRIKMFDADTNRLVAEVETQWGTRGVLRLMPSGTEWSWKLNNTRRKFQLTQQNGSPIASFKVGNLNRKLLNMELSNTTLLSQDVGIIALLSMYLTAVLLHR